MEMSAEYALNIIQNEVELFIYSRMNDGKISAGFMEKILESILCEIRKIKNQDLEKLIVKLNSQIPEVLEEKIEKHTTSIKESGEEKQHGNLQSNP